MTPTPPPEPSVYTLPGAASIRQAALYDAILQLTKRLRWLETVVLAITGSPSLPDWNYLTETEGNLLYTPLAHQTAPDPHTQYLQQPAVQALVDTAIEAHEADANPHDIYLTESEADLLYAPLGEGGDLVAHTHLDLATGGVIDYLRTQWGTDHLAHANPHPLYALDTDLAAYSPTSHNHAALYEPLDSAYTKSESDGRYATPANVSTAITNHEAAANPHSVYTTDAEVAAAVAAHVALADPHSQYATDADLAGYSPAAHNHNALYEPLDSAYTKAESDGRYATPASVTSALAAYVPLAGGSVMTGPLGPTTTNTRDLGTTALRWRKLWGVDIESTNTPTVGGVALPTFTTADARYLQSATAATTYVPLAGGSVLTGLLGPTTTNARDLGTTTLRWRKTWTVDADVLTGLVVASKAVALDPLAGNTLAWNAAGFYSSSPTKAQYDALVVRVAALEAQMGAGANGHYHTMGTWRQTNKATLPATVLEEAPAA